MEEKKKDEIQKAKETGNLWYPGQNQTYNYERYTIYYDPCARRAPH